MPFSHADDFSIMADERTCTFRPIHAVTRIVEGSVEIKPNFHFYRNNFSSIIIALTITTLVCPRASLKNEI